MQKCRIGVKLPPCPSFSRGEKKAVQIIAKRARKICVCCARCDAILIHLRGPCVTVVRAVASQQRGLGFLSSFQVFLSGYFGFLLSSKTNISKFHFDPNTVDRTAILWISIAISIHPTYAHYVTSIPFDTQSSPSEFSKSGSKNMVWPQLLLIVTNAAGNVNYIHRELKDSIRV